MKKLSKMKNPLKIEITNLIVAKRHEPRSIWRGPSTAFQCGVLMP